MADVLVYGIPNCDTVKKARAWLDAKGIAYTFHDYKKEGADPVKLRESVAPFHRWLARCDAREVLLAELLLHPDNSGLRLNGCGIAIVTPPWQLEHRIREWLPALKDLLAQGRYGSWRVDWLKRD